MSSARTVLPDGRRLVGVERVLEATARHVEHERDLAGQRARLVELAHGGRIGRVRRIVDQQHDPDVRELLQRGREERLADDAALLLVGRDDRRQRRVRHVEGRVDHGARHPPMRADALQVAEPRDAGRRRPRASAARRAAGRRRPRSCRAARRDDRRSGAPARRSRRARRRSVRKSAKRAPLIALREGIGVHDGGRAGRPLGAPLMADVLRLVSGRARRAPADPHGLPRARVCEPPERAHGECRGLPLTERRFPRTSVPPFRG